MAVPDLEIGNKVRWARLNAKLSQADLAVRSGVQIDTLRSIEQGRTRNPGILTMVAVATVLQISLDDLLSVDTAR